MIPEDDPMITAMDRPAAMVPPTRRLPAERTTLEMHGMVAARTVVGAALF
jgi:hypothetical protein